MRFLLIAVIAIGFACTASVSKENTRIAHAYQDEKVDTATFAGGCFWCVEASFEQIEGVYEVVSGYSGGREADASYNKVAAGLTNHAESVQIYYDPEVIDYRTLIEILFVAHDPTQLNRQGPDVGRQYRSAIFYETKEEKEVAKQAIKDLQKDFESQIVTLVQPLKAFYPAEEYHQDYERRNPYQPYIVNVSRPKIEKVAEKFSHLLKKDN